MEFDFFPQEKKKKKKIRAVLLAFPLMNPVNDNELQKHIYAKTTLASLVILLSSVNLLIAQLFQKVICIKI